MEIFYKLLFLLFATRVCGEIAHRIGLPSLLGELIAGVILGALAIGFTDTFPVIEELTHDQVFIAITNLGMFFIMLQGGLELHAKELAEVSYKSIMIGICGFILPLFCGFGLAWAYIPASEFKVAQCLLVGTGLAITAVPVSIGVLMQFKKLDSPAGKAIVSAAIIDDILSLILLAFLIGMINEGAPPGLAEFVILFGQIILFFLITFAFAWLFVPRIGTLIIRVKSEESEFTLLILGALAFAVLAEVLHLHFILGAFVAGLLFESRFTGEDMYQRIKSRISAITTGFFAPLFYASIGLNLDLSSVSEVPVFLILLILVAFFTKFFGAGIPALYSGFSMRDACAIGVGMSARGAVELVVADIALKGNLFSKPVPVPVTVGNLFSAIVLVALVTTIATPLLLKRIFAKTHDDPKAAV